MPIRRRRVLVLQALLSALAWSTAVIGQDAATFDPDGTAHVTRVVPEPTLVSKEARAWLDSLTHQHGGPQTLQQRRAATDEWRARD